MANESKPALGSPPNGKRLYGAYVYAPLTGKPTLVRVSHSVKALRRNCDAALVFQVRCIEKGAHYATYERVNKNPVEA